MIPLHILKSQADEIYLVLVEQKLEPSFFEWQETVSPDYKSKISKLVHTPTSYYFTFDTTKGGFWAQYSPAENTLSISRDVRTWSGLFGAFKTWVACLKREINSPNLWEEMLNQPKLIESASTEGDNTKFTKAEKEIIVNGIEEIKQYLLTAHKLDPELIEGQMKYLVESSNRLGRKDWKNALLGALMGILMTGAVSSAAAHEIFQFVWTVLHAVLTVRLLLT